ncbi:MAG: Fur family transcriptional regulator [Pseudomonadota bacterium]
MHQNRLEALCIQKGLKMTDQRRVLCEVLSEAVDHPDIEAIYDRARTRDPKISIATVYRTMSLFEELGVVQRHEFGGGRARYEERDETSHDHLIDIKSGAVVEFTNDALEALQKEMARKLGYRLQFHRLELYGVPLDREKQDGSGR